jgi:hypothetical protein
MNKVIAYYALKQHWQFGFEGVDIEVQKQKDVITHSETLSSSDIEVFVLT